MKTYLVLYPPHGHVWSDTGTHYRRELLIANMLGGHINKPLRIIEFDPNPVRCADVSTAIARELIREANVRDCSLPACIRDFVDRHYGAEAA